MKRGGPLKRRTPLKQGKRLSARSKRREEEAADRTIVREFVFARDGYRCRIGDFTAELARNHGVDPGPCRGTITPHHLRKASQLGPYEPENLITLCAGHNSWVEDYPAAAEAVGLSVTARGHDGTHQPKEDTDGTHR